MDQIYPAVEVRYGRMPHEDGEQLAEALASDALALVQRCRRLKVVTLGDGAEQIQSLRAKQVDEASFRRTITRLVDFWHVLEKLAALAVMVPGADARKERLAEHRRRLCTRPDAPRTILAELRASGRENPRSRSARCTPPSRTSRTKAT